MLASVGYRSALALLSTMLVVLTGCGRKTSARADSVGTTPVPAAPVASAIATASAAPRRPGPGCADVWSDIARFPSLLPTGYPRELVVHQAERREGKKTFYPPTALISDQGVFFIENDRFPGGQVTITRAVPDDPQRQPVKVVALPKQPGVGTLSSLEHDAAVGEKVIGLGLIAGKQFFFVTIDKQSWALRSVRDLKIEAPVRLISLGHPHVASDGKGNFGIVLRGLPDRHALDASPADDWDMVFALVGEDGSSKLGPVRFKGSGDVEPLIVWNGSTFAALGGAGKVSRQNLGIWTLPKAKGEAPSYRSWIKSDELLAPSLYVGGALRFEGDAYHVAVQSSSTKASKSLLIHAPVSSTEAVQMEECRPPAPK